MSRQYRNQNRQAPAQTSPPVAEYPTPAAQVQKGSTKVEVWKDTFGKMEGRIREALGQIQLDPRQMFAHAINAMQRNPKLYECSSYSVCGCLMQSAVLGLSLDPTLREAYMVPFKNKYTQKLEAQFIPGYIGLQKLARRSGKIKSIRSVIVFDGDYFKYTEDPYPSYVREPWEAREPKTRPEQKGRVKCAISIVETTESDRPLIDVMWKADLDRIQQRSLAKDSGPWVTDTEEMQRKTVFRRHCKWLPTEDALQKAVALDEMADLQIPQGMALLGIGDEAAYEQVQEAAQEQLKEAEGKPAPQPENAQQAPADAAKQAVMDMISARVKEMQGAELSWPPFDDACVAVAHALKLKTDNPGDFPIEGLNLLWEKIKPAEEATK